MIHPSPVFAYDPHNRGQIWRFFTYMFLHADIYHITFNCLVQVVVGEETVQGILELILIC